MGSPFVSDVRVKVELGDGLWIEIKEALSHADVRAIGNVSARLIRAKRVQSDDGPKVEMELREDFDLEADDAEMAKRAIVAWNFENGTGIAPINDTSFDKLKPEIWSAIIAALNNQYASMSTVQKKS